MIKSLSAPYLHKRVLWKSAGAETELPQTSPSLVQPAFSEEQHLAV